MAKVGSAGSRWAMLSIHLLEQRTCCEEKVGREGSAIVPVNKSLAKVKAQRKGCPSFAQ